MKASWLKKILIANRGEIAARIIHTCKKMDSKTVAIYSDADARSPYVREADEAAYIGPSEAGKSFLNKERIVAEAVSRNCDGLHPGYGFLSENQDFARMVSEAGIAFIGPEPSVIAALGDKMAAKEIAEQAGVPVVPGHHKPLADNREALEIARKIGFPVLLKPAAGGGGRGMRVIEKEADFTSAFTHVPGRNTKGICRRQNIHGTVSVFTASHRSANPRR